MAKLTKVLTFFLLLLSIAAFVLGYMLFAKREQIKGSNIELVKGVQELAAFIEGSQADPRDNDYPQRDLATVQATGIGSVDNSDFWVTYLDHLTDADFTPLTANEVALKSYPTTRKEMKRIVSKAEDQLAALNATRVQLKALREEHESTIEDANSNKGALRKLFSESDTLKNALADAEATVSQLENDLNDLELHNRSLDNEVNEKQDAIYALKERITGLHDVIEELKNTPRSIVGTEPDEPFPVSGMIGAGEKGQIVSVNNDWRYMILAINDQFLEEIKHLQAMMVEDNVAAMVPSIPLLVKRGPGYKTLVTRATLSQLHLNDRLAVLDIDPFYQELPVAKGDVAFY